MCNTQEKQEKHKAPQGKAAFFEKKAKTKNKGQFADKRQEKKKNAGKRQEKREKGHAGADQGKEIRTADRSGHGTHFQGGRTGKQEPKQRGGADAEKGAGHKEHFAGGGNAKRCGAAKSAGVYCRPAKRATVQNGGAQSKSRPQFEVIEGGRSGERPARDKAPRQQDPGREGQA